MPNSHGRRGRDETVELCGVGRCELHRRQSAADSFLCDYYFVYIACMCTVYSIVTWWGVPGWIEAYR